MRTITTKELIEANKQAYDEKRLCAQHMDNPGCVYIDMPSGTRCAIGVALNDDELTQISLKGLMTQSCTRIRNAGIVAFEDIVFADTLQEIHDRWAGKPDNEGFKIDYLNLLDAVCFT